MGAQDCQEGKELAHPSSLSLQHSIVPSGRCRVRSEFSLTLPNYSQSSAPRWHASFQPGVILHVLHSNEPCAAHLKWRIADGWQPLSSVPLTGILVYHRSLSKGEIASESQKFSPSLHHSSLHERLFAHSDATFQPSIAAKRREDGRPMKTGAWPFRRPSGIREESKTVCSRQGTDLILTTRLQLPVRSSIVLFVVPKSPLSHPLAQLGATSAT